MADVFIYPMGNLVLLSMETPDSISSRAAHNQVSLRIAVSEIVRADRAAKSIS